MDQSLPLRDIHLPEAVSWWPPAIGWWLLLILIPLSIWSLYWLYKRLTRRTAIKSAKRVLAEIKLNNQHDPLQQLQALSAWLRRVAMSQDSRQQTAALTGDKWLHYLDQSVEGSPFREGVGRVLADAHYRKTAPDNLDLAALTGLCEDWLRGQKR
ncbi:MAG: DUF4381 domain-containing protein [Cycloclasticus sp.]|nr:DUF4381 domain-containing protein [Cycloclasticus sp.]